MSTQQPSYEETVALVASLKDELNAIKVAAKKGTDTRDENDKLEASFKRAQEEHDEDKKEHEATTDDMEKVKEAFKKAEDETDMDKKKEAMKKALEMEEDYKSKHKGTHGKKARKAMPEDEKEAEEDEKKKEAKIASIVMRKVPIINKILEATKLIDPTNYGKVEKELTAATLEECEARLETIKPYIAATGLITQSPKPQGMPGMIPFQASSVVSDPNNIFEASIDDIDFSKVSTKSIMEMA